MFSKIISIIKKHIWITRKKHFNCYSCLWCKHLPRIPGLSRVIIIPSFSWAGSSIRLRLAAHFVTRTRYPRLPRGSPYPYRLITGRNIRRFLLSSLIPPSFRSLPRSLNKSSSLFLFCQTVNPDFGQGDTIRREQASAQHVQDFDQWELWRTRK